jgi:hypothetical protein
MLVFAVHAFVYMTRFWAELLQVKSESRGSESLEDLFYYLLVIPYPNYHFRTFGLMRTFGLTVYICDPQSII